MAVQRNVAPRKTWYPLYRRLVGSLGLFERVRKISPTPGFDPRTVQPVASRYTDWAIPTNRQLMMVIENVINLELEDEQV